MLHSLLMSLILFAGFAVGGCATGRLESQMDRLERELGDQRSVTKRLEERLDDLQIRVTLLDRKLGGGHPKSSRADRPGDMPPLAVVHLEDHPVAERRARPKPARRREPWKLKTAKFEEVDPAEVTERLQVDRAAARRPLADGDAAADGRDPQVAAEDAADAAEAAEADRVFQDAFGLYRVNELAKAATALDSFARTHGDHPLAPDAMFYAAKSLMLLGKADQAEREFLELVRAYPSGERSAEALLLAGRCQEKLGRAKEARSTYLQLVDAYPLSEQAGKANKRLQSIR